MTSEFPSVILGSNRIAPFNPIVLYSHSSNYLREKMPEEDEPPDHVSASDFRTTHVSFDIEDDGRPRRRRKRDASLDAAARPRRIEHDDVDDHVTECPGCGADVEEGEFVESLLSFITGSKDYLAGDPVRVRSVQRLQQITPGGMMPEPQSEWTIEVVNRIEEHIEKMAEERKRLLFSQERIALEGEILKKVQAEVRDQLIAAANGVGTLPAELDPSFVATRTSPATPVEVERPAADADLGPSNPVEAPPEVGSGPENAAEAEVDEDGIRWWEDEEGGIWYQPPGSEDWFSWTG